MSRSVWILAGVLALTGLCVPGCSGEAPVEIAVREDHTVLRREQTEGTLKNVASFTARVRLFGAEPRGTPAPFNLDDYKFIATPLKTAREAFDRHLCERTAAGKASMIQVVIADESVRPTVETLVDVRRERVCLEMAGRSGELASLSHQGRRLGGYTNPSGSDVNYDPERFVLLEEIRRIECTEP